MNRPRQTPLHCVHIQGDPETGLLVGYVEFYGCQRMVVGLSSQYDGSPVKHTYAVNPSTGEELDIKADMNFSRADLEEIYNYDKIPDGAVETAVSEVLPFAQTLAGKAEQNRTISDAVKYAFENCGAQYGEELSTEQCRMLSGLVFEKLRPYLEHRISQQRRPNPQSSH